jgi:MFS family permease
MRIYLCPALIDWVLFLVLFAVMYAAGERGLTVRQSAWLGGLFQLSYMLTSLLIGTVLSRRNARPMLLVGTVFTFLLGVACLFTTAFVPLLVLLCGVGACSAVFFNAFQTFMRGEAQPGDLARAVARYTLAWSLGSSLGFLVSGMSYRLGPGVMAGLTLAVGAVTLGVLLRHNARPHEAPSADEHVEEAGGDARPVNPRYVWVGWVIIFTAMFVQRPLQTFLPPICAKDGIGPLTAGLLLFVHMFVQGVFGLACVRLRHLLYRRTPLWLFQGGAAAVFVAAWLWPGLPALFAAASLLGVYAGFAYFCAVYYASNSGRRSFNIGVNECLVGLGSFAGLFLSERGVQLAGTGGMYLVCAGALAVATVLQLALASTRGQ